MAGSTHARWVHCGNQDAYRDTWNVYPIITALEMVNGYELFRYDLRVRKATLDRALTLHAKRRGRKFRFRPWKQPR